MSKIKANRKYQSISDDIIKKEINRYFISHKKPESKREEELLIKNIRAQLHRSYASYQTRKKSSITTVFNELENAVKTNNKSAINNLASQLLSLTLSTKERLPYYQEIYEKLFVIAGKPKTIIDLGSGFNPFSIPYMHLHHLTYYAYDIDDKDIMTLNEYFKIMKSSVQGWASIMDLEQISINDLPSSDIVFMFKVIDLIDSKSKKKRKISEDIIKKILEKNKTTYIVASFATKTLTRKSMNLPRRIGFEKMLERNQLQFKLFSIENEIFYVISKK